MLYTTTARSAATDWAHVECREFSGRGLYHWARGCLRQCMQDVSHKAQGTITLQVETLSGLTLALNLVSPLLMKRGKASKRTRVSMREPHLKTVSVGCRLRVQRPTN